MKRQAVLLLTTMVVGLVLASGTAMAVTKTCVLGATVCKGTKEADVIKGSIGSDTIKALGGNDKITGAEGHDDTFGGGGNDKYFYLDDFGSDEVCDLSGIDTVNFSGFTGSDMYISVVPEWAVDTDLSLWHMAHTDDPLTAVAFFSSCGRSQPAVPSVIERVVGSSKRNGIAGGKENNTLDPGSDDGDGPSGPSFDSLEDFGGHPGDVSSRRRALPASDDTYKGFRSGFVWIRDWGGTNDTVDFRPARSSEATQKTVDNHTGTNNGGMDTLEIHISTARGTVSTWVECHFGDSLCGSLHGTVERFVFADRVLGANEIGNLPLAP